MTSELVGLVIRAVVFVHSSSDGSGYRLDSPGHRCSSGCLIVLSYLYSRAGSNHSNVLLGHRYSSFSSKEKPRRFERFEIVVGPFRFLVGGSFGQEKGCYIAFRRPVKVSWCDVLCTYT